MKGHYVKRVLSIVLALSIVLTLVSMPAWAIIKPANSQLKIQFSNSEIGGYWSDKDGIVGYEDNDHWVSDENHDASQGDYFTKMSFSFKFDAFNSDDIGYISAVYNSGSGDVNIQLSDPDNDGWYTLNTAAYVGGTAGTITIKAEPAESVTFVQNGDGFEIIEGETGSKTISSGTTKIFPAEDGYKFRVNVFDANNEAVVRLSGASEPLKAVDGVYTVNESGTVTVSLTESKYNVTVKNGEGYAVSKANFTVAPGASETFMIIPATGYRIVNVSADNATVINLEGNNWMVSNVTADTEITVAAEKLTYTVSFPEIPGLTFKNVKINNAAVADFNGVVSSVPYGSSVSFEIATVPENGYNGPVFYINGVRLTATAGVYTTGAVTENVSITYDSFGLKTYTVTVPSINAGYTFTANSSTTVQHGETFSFTLVPSAGYTIKNVTVTGGKLTNVGTLYTVTEITDNVTFTIEVAQDTYNVTVPGSVEGKYTVSGSATGTYTYGQQVSITVDAVAPYKVASVTANGTALTLNGNAYTYTVTGETVIAVEYELDVDSLFTLKMSITPGSSTMENKIVWTTEYEDVLKAENVKILAAGIFFAKNADVLVDRVNKDTVADVYRKYGNSENDGSSVFDLTDVPRELRAFIYDLHDDLQVPESGSYTKKIESIPANTPAWAAGWIVVEVNGVITYYVSSMITARTLG